MLNPWRLRLLSQLETLGTIRAVAQAASLSPSSVSQQLTVLEAETHTRLLERTGRQVRLTPAGLVLARRARAILDHMAEVEAELHGLSDEPAGLVRLGAFESAIHSLAVPVVTKLAQSHPRLDVELIELEAHESMPALQVGDVDVIITAPDFVELPIGPDIATARLTTDRIVLVVSPERYPDPGPTDLADYAEQPWALDMPRSYMANLASRLCRQAGFEPRVVCRFSSYMTTLQHVEAGLSVALLPSLTVDPRFHVAMRELTTPVTRTITAAVRRGSRPRAAVQLVLDALREYWVTTRTGL